MKTKSITYRTSKTAGKENINVKIMLADECKNGHQDFSITGDVYEAGKPKIDRYMITCGCIHEDILKHFPEFKIFIDLHLADYRGIPMYATANGFYHLKNGFNDTPINNPSFAAEFCEYYRITPKQFETLKTSETQDVYAFYLGKLGIYEQWKKQADEAIKTLESLTGSEFLIDNPKERDYNLPSEKIQEIEKLIESDFFTPEKIEAREQQKRKDKAGKKINDLKEKASKDIKAINRELKIKIALFSGGLLCDNFIHYTHTNVFTFNWLDYHKRFNESEIEQAKKILLKIDKSIKFENKNKGRNNQC